MLKVLLKNNGIMFLLRQISKKFHKRQYRGIAVAENKSKLEFIETADSKLHDPLVTT